MNGQARLSRVEMCGVKGGRVKPAWRRLRQNGITRHLADHHVKEKTQPMRAAGSRKVFHRGVGIAGKVDNGINPFMVGGEKNIAVGAGRKYRREQDMVEAHVLAAA